MENDKGKDYRIVFVDGKPIEAYQGSDEHRELAGKRLFNLAKVYKGPGSSPLKRIALAVKLGRDPESLLEDEAA